MQSVNRFLFGPTKEERVKQVQSQLRSEQRHLDREIRNIDTAVSKAKQEVKRLATKSDVKSAKILARQVVRSQAQRNRLVTSKARLNSIGLQLNHQLAMYKVTGSMAKSAEIMKLSKQLVKLPQLNATMRQMSEEMVKAGIMEEMMEDTMDSGVLGEDEDEMEEEAQGAVDKVLFELTDGKLGQMASTGPLPDLEAPQPVQASNSRQEEEEDMQRMQAALDGLLKG